MLLQLFLGMFKGASNFKRSKFSLLAMPALIYGFADKF